MLRTSIVFLGCALLFGCGVSKQTLTQVEDNLRTCQNTLSQVSATNKACQDELAAIESTKEELEEKTKTYEDLMASLKDEVEDGKIKISQMQGRLTVNLIDKILFDSGSTTVKTGGKSALKKIADVLKKVDDKQVQVEGHTDNVPVGASLKKKFPTNWELSTARATSVVKFLSHSGVSEQKLSATGYSMFAPVASNDSDEGRRQNRRIEIVLVPDVKAMPADTTPETKTDTTPETKEKPAEKTTTPDTE